MTNLGRYDPSNEEHLSSLFRYGEVPVESEKLNRWNGNIEAALEAATRALSRLANRDQNGVLDLGTGSSLEVAPQSAPDLTVRVLPGLGIIHPYVVGRTAGSTFPEDENFEPPEAWPRIDLVYVTMDGFVGIITGSEGYPPVAPDVPDHCMALAEVYLRPGCTSIEETDDGENGYLIDRRNVIAVGKTHRHNDDLSPPETADGSNTHFSTSNQYQTGTLDVFVNGILYATDIDYSEDSDRRGYTFFTAPPPHAVLQHRYLIEKE